MRPYHAATTRIAWLACLSGLAGFAIIAVAVTAGMTEGADRALLLAFRDADDLADAWGPAWFEEMAAEVTTLGGYPVLVVTGAVALTVLWLLGQRPAAVFLLTSLVGGTLLSTLLKQVFERPRPDLVTQMDRTFTSSFPSAHAMVSMLAWLVLAAVAARFIPRRSVRLFLLATAFLFGIAIGVSRVYLGVHWPSDVVAGWCIGIAWAAACWLVAHHLPIGHDAPIVEP